MTRAEAFEEARRRIREAAASGAILLDLGDLPLEELPDELGSLRNLEILALGHRKPGFEAGKLEWEIDWDRRQESSEHPLKTLQGISGLSALRHLDLTGLAELTDLAPLAGLTGLQSLDCSGCEAVSDLAPLAGLTGLQSLTFSGCEAVSDLAPLAGLTGLQSLTFSGCEAVSDLAPLAGLTGLQRLDFSFCKAVSDLAPLAELTGLQRLDCSFCKAVSDLAPLAGLTGLQSLYCSYCEAVSDLAPLAGLTDLQSLDCSGCEAVSDLAPLAGLTGLQSLDCSYCEAVSDLAPLAGLTGLQSLDCSGCEAVSDLAPLAGLTGLQSLTFSGCEAVSDLAPLAGLTGLQSLDCSFCKAVSDLAPLAGLTGLQSLDCSSCEAVSDLAPLAGLTGLQSLDFSSCPGVSSLEPLIPVLPNLDSLSLFGCRLRELPEEVCGAHGADNVIEDVRAHLADVALGFTQDAEIKVFVLGNGGVGKTQLCRRLKDQPFDPAVSTTHGIQLGQVALALDTRTEVRLNLWDFGGQDIYHGSHTLFLQGQGIFVLLWNPGRESGDCVECGVRMRHHPLAYWLDYVRGLAGTGSPVLLVQSRCDTPRDRATPSSGMPADDFAYLRPLEFSARTDLGLDLLRAHLKEAVRFLFDRRPPPPIGLGRVRVRDRLREMLAEDQGRPPGERQHRTLTLEEFGELCGETGKVSSPARLLDYLHRQGVVFYRAGVFGDRIILDQTWALEAIYTIFHREHTLPVFNRDGRFTRRELELLVWRHHPAKDQELFLELMQSCGICFPVRNRAQPGEPPEWEYVAPELLPEWSEAQRQLAGRLQSSPPGAAATVRYRFLHEGILRGLLSKLGRRAGDAAIYWKYGCWFWEETHRSQVLIRSTWSESADQPGAGTIMMEGWGDAPAAVLAIVLEELLSHPVGQPPDVEKSWRDEELLRHRRLPQQLPFKLGFGPEVESRPDRPAEAMDELVVPERPVIPAAIRPEVFISYAWGDDASETGRQRGEIVEQLCARLETWGFTVQRDCKVMRNGDLISAFMKRIGQGDCVIVILSEKYLRSPYCMTELHAIYERSNGSQQEFLKRIIPVVLDDARISNWRDRRDHAGHWRQEYEEMERNLTDLGVEDVRLHHVMRKWHADIGDMLHFIADQLAPRGFDACVASDFKGVRQLLGLDIPPGT